MLVLSRKLGESVRIADDVVIKLVQIRPGRVRLGIEAPEHIRIAREETVPPSSVEPPDCVRDEFPHGEGLDVVVGSGVAC